MSDDQLTKDHDNLTPAERLNALCITKELLERFWAKVKQGGPDDCWTWTACCHEWGYGLIGIVGIKRLVRAHRLSWVIANGPILNGLWVLHRCDNPSCVNPAHLFLGTHRDNMRDCAKKRRCGSQAKPEHRPRGENHWQSKTSDAQVVDIRSRYAAGEKAAVLSREYGIAVCTVRRMVRGEGWSHLPVQPYLRRRPPTITLPRVPKKPTLFGEAHDRAKLSSAKAREAILLYREGQTYVQLATRFNVTSSTIMQVVNGKRWKQATADLFV